MSTLIIDTSALINLSDIYVGRRHITELLSQLFAVQVPTEIPTEIRRHRNQLLGYESEILSFATSARKRFHRQGESENILMTGFAPAANPQRNRGERFMCALGLYLTRKRITGHVILLTDDLNAHRGFVGWFEQRFRITKTWTSLDLLLYIYAVTHPHWPMAQASVTLQTINARMRGPNPMVVMRRLLEYRRYLNQSNALLNALPQPRKGAMV
jgi:hypothetical protein